MPDVMVRCETHPALVAAWRCSECDKTLCVDCAAPDWAGKLRIARCVHCLAMGDPIRYTPEITPFLRSGPMLWAGVTTTDSLVQLAALAVILGFASLLPFIYVPIAMVLVAAYYLQVLRHTSKGGKGLPLWGMEQSEKAAVGLLKLIVATWYVWMPFGLYLGENVLDVMLLKWSPFSDPLSFVFLLFGCMAIPASLMAAAFGSGMYEIANPMTAWRFARAQPDEYGMLAAVWTGTVILDRLMAIFFWWIYWEHLTIPLFVPGILGFVGLFVPVLSAMIVGRFVWQNGEVLGIFRPQDRIREQVPGAVPQQELVKPDQPDELPTDMELAIKDPFAVPPGDEDIEIELSDTPIDYAEAGEGLPMDQDQAVNFEDGIDLAEEDTLTLADAIAGGEAEKVRELYRQVEHAGSVRLMQADDLIGVAHALEKLGDLGDSAAAWRHAVEVDQDGPRAAEAVYGLARLMDKMGQKAPAKALLAELLQRYPKSAEATKLREKLAGDSEQSQVG